MTIGFRDWSRQAGTRPVIWPQPEPRIIIRVRAMAAIYAQHTAHIDDGEPLAEIDLNRSRLRFPSPFKANGHPTVRCRQWLTKAVAQTIVRDGHHRMIEWPDETFTTFSRAGEASVHRSLAA